MVEVVVVYIMISEYYWKIKEVKDAIEPLSGRSLNYCTDNCLRRYLEARNWNADKSKKMLEDTLKWRSTYKPEDIRWVSFALLSFGVRCCDY